MKKEPEGSVKMSAWPRETTLDLNAIRVSPVVVFVAPPPRSVNRPSLSELDEFSLRSIGSKWSDRVASRWGTNRREKVWSGMLLVEL
jgi:hypothetical protein